MKFIVVGAELIRRRVMAYKVKVPCSGPSSQSTALNSYFMQWLEPAVNI